MDTVPVWSHLFYLAISVASTVFVARTLQRNGRVFLRQLVIKDEEIADAVNNLLVVGFYLINFGYVALALKYGDVPTDAAQGIETVSSKVGLVFLVLGFMHFMNLYIFSKLRKRALLERTAPPVPADEHVSVRGVRAPEATFVR